jgi:DNA-binding transcriptional MerR regulator
MLNQERTTTPSEAAVVSGVPVKTVHREIDQGPLKPKRRRPGSKRALSEQDLFYLAAAKGLDTRLVQLTGEGKDKLHDAILAYWRSKKPAKKELPVFGGRLLLDLKLVREEVRSRLERLERAEQWSLKIPRSGVASPALAEPGLVSMKSLRCSNRARPKRRFWKATHRLSVSTLNSRKFSRRHTPARADHLAIRGNRRPGVRSRGARLSGEISDR